MGKLNLEFVHQTRFNSFLSDVFGWMMEDNKLERALLKSSIHSMYGANKNLFWTTVMHILTGKYDIELDIDHTDIVYPFIEEDEIINI